MDGILNINGGTIYANCTLDEQGTTDNSYGIQSRGDLTISGNASVTAEGGAGENCFGIGVGEDLVISDNASVTATGGEATYSEFVNALLIGDKKRTFQSSLSTQTIYLKGSYFYEIFRSGSKSNLFSKSSTGRGLSK